ncbi:hypothetical protein EV202_1449 [Bacteroides heparinolyticus]|uniref:Uncharacterized protein n=1 Tax=Prevotella heparinolytica TaxID=28113 RepID=A0A4R2LQ59_9BACE|nr:hypothetical protein EV202_1449 [Bacteroides heparinolyticus]
MRFASKFMSYFIYQEIPPLASIGFILEDTSLFQALIILQLAQYFVHHPIGKCSTFSITIAD